MADSKVAYALMQELQKPCNHEYRDMVKLHGYSIDLRDEAANLPDAQAVVQCVAQQIANASKGFGPDAAAGEECCSKESSRCVCWRRAID